MLSRVGEMGQRMLWAALLACGVLLAGCATPRGSGAGAPLRVGVSPNYPPLVSKQGDKIVGAEADLARLLAKQLGRPLVFVELGWDELIPALNEERIDIIMSGMSITRPRGLRVMFCEPFLRNALAAIAPAADRDKYPTQQHIVELHGRIAVVKGTTGDAFVEAQCSNAQRVLLKKAADALYFFDGRRMDIFVHDIYALAWLVSQNETLAGLWLPLTDEWLAWAVRRTDQSLKRDVDAILAEWQADATLDRVLDVWLPGRENIQWPEE